MNRRAFRRIWHTFAALVPLPIIGLGYIAAVPGNPVAFQIQLYLAGEGSVQPLTRQAESAPRALPRAAAMLFRSRGKGPRADQPSSASNVTSGRTPMIAASLAGDPTATGALWRRGKVNGEAKSDRIKSPASAVALSSSLSGSDVSLMMMAAASTAGLYSLHPSPEEVAYHPTPDGLNFRYKGETQAEFEERERHCLATAIYFEARGEPKQGQVAVAQVILNRVRSPLFPATICGVVYQGQMNPGCQFSFTCDGKTDNPRDGWQWAQAKDIAKRITAGELWLPDVGYSTYYHANYVSPKWVGDMNKIDRIGRHIFYKKRNETPYVVEASAESSAPPEETTASSASLFSFVPGVSQVSSAGEGSSSSSTPAMSLGFAASE
jgi:hypothetical protein